ncbi:MAG: DNA-3-methyladenine glycosylase [Syntrophomonadaceae bacterium]|nr:DNA-3-methyladenine glycosylase [Syntrophomonadaceae bacterium]
MHKLPRKFYMRDTLIVAEALIGCYLVSNINKEYVIGRINETEAYIGPVDKACHAYLYKRTGRTEPLFAEGGIAYVYFVYGMHHCMNVVTEKEGVPCAVLIRGLEIVQGLETAASNRYKKNFSDLSAYQKKNLANGPGKLCKALNITAYLNRTSLLAEPLFICDKANGFTKRTSGIATGKRIGIDYAEEAKDFPWRFYEP